MSLRYGIVYILHFSHAVGKPQSDEARAERGLPPRMGEYKPHARHYVGFTEGPDASERINRHLSGNGAKLVASAIRQGASVCISRLMEGTDGLERQIKRQKNTARFCPLCNPDFRVSQRNGNGTLP